MFRPRCNTLLSSAPVSCKVTKYVSEPKEINGQVINFHVCKEVDIMEDVPMPSREEYSLQNLMASGQPLQPIDISSLLSPTALHSIEQKFGDNVHAFLSLQKVVEESQNN